MGNSKSKDKYLVNSPYIKKTLLDTFFSEVFFIDLNEFCFYAGVLCALGVLMPKHSLAETSPRIPGSEKNGSD